MGILSDFERRLEGVIEGIFAKAFRTGLHPVELATRILREMEAGKTVGVRNVWVPNHFVFHISPEDADRFAQTEQALRRELEQVVRDGARERGWGLVGPASVEFETDPERKQGAFDCEATLVEGPGGTPAPDEAPAGGGAADDGRAAELVRVDASGAGRPVELSKARTVIGRLPESDVVVDDPGASRRHAEVRREHGEFVVADLGSTNGTMVNESPVGEHVLQDGDRITIGKTVLEFRRR
ncbi:MAG TPA: DUF3662 and FHA domain-containing protein [Actinomycetota bacterium]